MSTPSLPPTMMRRRSAQAYASVGLETKIMSATPEQLITLLLEGARAAIIKARLHLKQGNTAERGSAISRAIDIVDSGLRASVDTEQGGEVAQSLIATYELIIRHLMLANMHASNEHLTTAENMLKDITEAWQEITTPGN
ncbi:MAG TPA: flagellar export chaperone FliS [Burkholderiaceae bacterium]|nr:flagellar export chaperone FliS [Burkholderiaceae bacterium]